MNYNLSQYYYKNQSKRKIEGFDSSGWWFTGGTSFMSNGYVIYSNGLDGDPPNPTALSQGLTYKDRLMDHRSFDKRSSFSKFIGQLEQIANQAAEDESRYLQLKLDQLRSNSSIDVKWLDKIEQAIHQQDYGSAYTLLLNRDKALKEFTRELNSKKNKSVAKTNDFFNSQFYKFIANKFSQQLQGQKGLQRHIELDDDFESLVDEFLSETLGGTQIDSDESLNFIRQTFIDGLQELADLNGGHISLTTTKKAFGKDIRAYRTGTQQFRDKIPRSAILKKNGTYRSSRQIADGIAYALMGSIGRGLSTEVYTIGNQRIIGGKAYSTGSITTNYMNEFTGKLYAQNVQQRNDVVTFDVFSEEVDIDNIIQSVYGMGYDATMREFYEEAEKALIESAETSSDDFFEIVTSTKGYLSDFDISIASEGSFYNRMSTLKTLKLDGGMVDKLIFMLNNTTKGCIMENRIHEIQDYLASVCVAWIWDSPEEIFNLELKAPQNFHKIRLFNVGAAYLTASQIIKQTLERLIAFGEDSNKFVQVNITPAPAYGNYTDLKQRYSVNGLTSKDEWQAMLQKRWDEVKNEAMANGSLSITFNQEELNQLIGNLKNILNS